jgi:hypothetical protein
VADWLVALREVTGRHEAGRPVGEVMA